MKLRLMIVVLTTALMASCSTTQYIEADYIAFHVDSYLPGGSIAVISVAEGDGNSLEFRAYRRKVEDKLFQAGYVIQRDPKKADFIGFLAYGIDNGETKNVNVPIIGQTSGGTTHHSGTVSTADGNAAFSGSSYTMPTYGVVGTTSREVTTYERVVALNIVDSKSLGDGQPDTHYEGQVRSRGWCPIVSEVFDEMLTAMFYDFPGENGRNQKQRIEGEFNC